MVWDTTLPSMVGYISGLLWNQNNVDSSTSPVTTTIEITVAKELCCMLGFSKSKFPFQYGLLQPVAGFKLF